MSIALVPDARGQGLGRRLAQMLEQAATRAGLPAMNVGGVTAGTRGFNLRLGYQGRGSMMRTGLPLSALRRDPDGWRRDLAGLRARREQRLAATARPPSGGSPEEGPG